MPGYKEQFVHSLLKRYECPICVHAMRNPMQTECGHLFCRDCLEYIFKESRPVCPLDKEEISRDHIFPDNACHREILNLDVYCTFYTGGCQWTGKLEELEVHSATECDKEFHPCPNQCDDSLRLKKSELQRHLTEDCLNSLIECPFKKYGCLISFQRKELPVHTAKFSVYHTEIHGREVDKNINNPALTVEDLEKGISGTDNELPLKELHYADPQGSSDSEDERDHFLTQCFSPVVPECDERKFPISATTETATVLSQASDETDSKWQQRVQNVTEDIEKASKSEMNREQCLDSLLTLSNFGEISDQLDQEITLQWAITTRADGNLIWRIDSFKQRRDEALVGRTLFLYSTPFYTSRRGYKMSAKIYLNGNGLGMGTHLSVFFVIMSGPSDGLLEWPFKQKVTLTLINQSGNKHVTYSFHPDPHSNCFQYPGRKEMNIAYGYPMFIRVDDLLNGGFVKDDCIFLRIVVDNSVL